MSIQSILSPVLVEAGLIFALGLWMIAARNGRGPGDPARVRQIGDSFSNQFELPMLFFALAPLAILTRAADALFVAMSWIFVGSRIAHAAIHTTSNQQPARGVAWLLGVVALAAMWILFAIHVLSGGP